MAHTRTHRALAWLRPGCFILLTGLFAPVFGCGDPIASGSYRGTPVLTISGQIGWSDTTPADPSDVRLAMFYTPSGLRVLDADEWVEHLASSTSVQALPFPLLLNVFENPTSELLIGPERTYGLARLVLYRDTNHDKKRQSGEPILGLTPTPLWIYAATPIPAGKGPTAGALPVGFSALTTGQQCDAPPPAFGSPGTCGVPLGSSCMSDPQCNGGVCLRETKFSWPSGYCAIPEATTTTCRPGSESAAYLGEPQMMGAPNNLRGFFIKKCQKDADCVRPTSGPSDKMGYICDPGLSGCVPAVQIILPASNSGVKVDPFCN
jgi:hypothetical protein